MSTPAPKYSRISISNIKDTEKLYSLLKTYAQDPSLAETVSEVIIDTQDCFPMFDNSRPKKQKPKDSPIDEPHIALHAYIRSLALDKNTTFDFIGAVDTKRRAVMGWHACESDSNCSSLKFEVVGLALLFSFCKNITTLYLAEELHHSVKEYMIKLNYGDIKNPGLQNLKHVHFTASRPVVNDSRYYATVEILGYMQLIHRLPALESVTMDALQEYQPTYVYFVPRSGNMKKLEITHCHINSDYLMRMISVPKALEEFKLSIGGMWSIDGGSQIYSPSQMGNALAAHKDTLRVLDLDAGISIRADNYPGYKYKVDEPDMEEQACRRIRGRPGDPYGRDRIAADKAISVKPEIKEEDAKEHGRTVVSFHDYPRLTHLSIGMIALLGDWDDYRDEPPFKLVKPAPFRFVECLPSILEYLCIYGYVRGVNPDVDEHVDEFLAKRSEKLPKLKAVKGIEELVPGLMDVFGRTDLSDEKDLYVRDETGWEWKEVEV
jgi:hypothetical protein